jgi:hypothetical protein
LKKKKKTTFDDRGVHEVAQLHSVTKRQPSEKQKKAREKQKFTSPPSLKNKTREREGALPFAEKNQKKKKTRDLV